MPWAWIEDQWAEVHQPYGYRYYVTVDSRISRATYFLRPEEVYQEKPTDSKPKPTIKIGDKIRIRIRRIFTGVEIQERSGVSLDAVWSEIDDGPDLLTITAAEIISVNGVGTHICGYCEEYSANNPPESACCRGCGHMNWEVWNAPVVGPIPKPN